MDNPDTVVNPPANAGGAPALVPAPDPEPLPVVRRYDFRTARKLTQNQRLRFGAWHSRWAAWMAKRFQELFKMDSEASFLGLEQAQGASFPVADFAEVVSAEISLHPGQRKIYLVWPRDLAFFMIEKILGATGEELFTEKPLSDFEKGILERVSMTAFQGLQTALDHRHGTEGRCEVIREGLESFSDRLPYDILLLGRINLRINGRNGKLAAVYPYSVAKPWLDNGSAAGEEAAAASAEPGRSGLPRGVAAAPVRVQVFVEPTPIKLADFTNLQVGDCLQLNHGTQEPFAVVVNQRLKFKAHLGVLGGQLAVKIAAKVPPRPETK